MNNLKRFIAAQQGMVTKEGIAYKQRILGDGGTLRNWWMLNKLNRQSKTQDTFSNIKFAWFGEAGSKIRTSGINSYVSNAYNPVIPALKYGPELVVNGGFDTADGWTLGTGWAIGSGKATRINAGVTSTIHLVGAVVLGKTYKITFTVTDYISGTITNDGTSTPTGRVSNGTYTETYISRFGNIQFFANAAFSGSIDNISVVEVKFDGLPVDAKQTTELSQPNLSGNIAPNEKLCLSNANGQTKCLTHPTISFAANEAWSVTTVLNWNGSNTINNRYYAGGGINLGLFVSPTDLRFYYVGTTEQTFVYPIRSKIGKVSVITLIADGSGFLSVYLDGILIEKKGANTSGTFTTIFQANLPFNGKLYAHIIRSGALTPAQVSAEYNFFRSLYPEIETVNINGQNWATSNLDMVCTPQGTVIQEIQANTNVEKITNGGFDVNNNWSFANAGISNGVATITLAGGQIMQNSLTANKWYKATLTISGYVSGTAGISDVSTSASNRYSNANGTFTIYFNANGLAPTSFRLTSTVAGVSFDNVSVQEIGWNSSTELYNAIYAQTAGTVEQKTYAAVKAAAMWSFYNNDPTLGSVYGKLYNWYAVKLLQMDIDYYNLANPATPWGYRVPADVDFTILQTNLGGVAVAGGKMKVAGTLYFATPNTGANNSSGFSALGSGYRGAAGSYSFMSVNFLIWGITINTRLYISNINANLDVVSSGISLQTGFAIRLIKS